MKKKLLNDIQDTLSALDRAEKLQIKAASVGFDWQNSNEIIKKIEEELNEVREAIASNRIHDNLSEEIGDLIFSCINLARYHITEYYINFPQSHCLFKEHIKRKNNSKT